MEVCICYLQIQVCKITEYEAASELVAVSLL